MHASILDILHNHDGYVDQVVNTDGILVMADYNRERRHFEQVWLVKQGSPRNRAIRAQPISSDSTLWHGLSRLNPRHLPGYHNCRVHDAARACVRVLSDGTPSRARLEILSAAIFRREFTLYVGERGVRLDQALPPGARVHSIAEIQANIARCLGRRCYVYGTLVIRASPPAQFLKPGLLPYSGDSRGLAEVAGDFSAAWLEDIEYPQSDSAPRDSDALPDSIHIDQEYPIGERLSILPGINQTTVKPAIIVGSLRPRDQAEHFATLSRIEQVYLQNICYSDLGKAPESVIKLKNFEDLAEVI